MPVTRRLMELLLPLVLLLAACGTNDDPAAGGGGGGGDGGEDAAAGGGDVTGELTVWGMGAEGEKLSVLGDMFTEEHPDVTVNVTPIAWDVAHDRLVTAVAGGQTPDVSQLGTTWVGEFAKLGAIAPTPDSIDPANFFEGAWGTTEVDGTSYGVPWYVETRLLYYRTDVAEKAGVDGCPATWDELKSMAEALQSEGGAENGISLATGTGSWQTYLPFMWSNGGEVLTDTGEFALGSPEAVEALDYYDSFFEEGLTNPMPEGFDITQGFIQGTYPMFFSGPWHMGLIDDTGGEEFSDKWGLCPMPEKKSGTSFVGGSNMVAFTESDNKATAQAFLEFISQPEVQAAWYEEVAALPAVKAAWEQGELADDERLSMFGEQLEDAKAPPSIPTWEEVASQIDDSVERAAIGNASPEEAAKAMEESAQSIGTGQ